MASTTDKIRKFLASPRGRRLTERAQRELAKPSTQQKLRGLMTKINRPR